ncbi:MAG: fluoride efflux transporter CrcB [Verrucomicrobiota bacterium]
MEYLWIALGSALGGMGRYWLSGVIANRVGETFPWGTMFVNVTGSFLIGFLAVSTATEGRLLMSPMARKFLLVGILGGYTTFSSFSLQTLNLMQEGQWGAASLNILLSVAACLLAVWLGHVAGQALSR